ncbi:MAG: hypothetical protein JWM11_7973 [Planctomycetaceae bacterium]|nr:hypothetical protein [Planctomycetaceae bacterium]
MSYVLPEGWTTARLDTLFDVHTGGTPDRKQPQYFQNGTIPWVRTGEVNNTDIYHSEIKITQEALENSSAKLFPASTLLVALYGEGRTRGQVARLMIAAATNQACSALVNPELPVEMNQLVYWSLRRDYQRLREQSAGGNQPNLNNGIIKAWEIPIPPLAEQRRIVLKLELLLEKVSSSQQRLARVPGLLKRFRQSVLAAACSGKLTADWREVQSSLDSDVPRDSGCEEMELPFDVPSHWNWSSLDVICTKITDGEHLTPPRVVSGVPILSAKDVRDNDVEFNDAKFVTAEFAAQSRQRCNPEFGDILVVSRGATVGRTCRVKTHTVFCLMGSVLLFKPKSEVILPEIIEYCFKTPTGLAALIARSGATAQQAIYIRDMRTFPIPIPPLTEQQEIVRRVEKLFAFADQIEEGLRKAQTHVERLTQSLLAKAFQGKLVPTEAELARREGRDYEPATALLERIKNDQKSPPNGTKPASQRKRRSNPS